MGYKELREIYISDKSGHNLLGIWYSTVSLQSSNLFFFLLFLSFFFSFFLLLLLQFRVSRILPLHFITSDFYLFSYFALIITGWQSDVYRCAIPIVSIDDRPRRNRTLSKRISCMILEMLLMLAWGIAQTIIITFTDPHFFPFLSSLHFSSTVIISYYILTDEDWYLSNIK